MILSALFQQLLCFFLHVETSGAFRKPLSQKEELRCFQQMRAGDASAREKLILHNMRLVAHIIKKYYTNQTEQEDLLFLHLTMKREHGLRLMPAAALKMKS